jgi:predicted phage tail protein
MVSTDTATLVEIRLHGHLRERFGSPFHVAVRSPAEALRALVANLPGFASAFHEAPFYSVLVDGEPIPFEEVRCCRGTAVLDFVPSVTGSKSEVGTILLFSAAMFLTAGLIGGAAIAGGGLFSFAGVGAAGWVGATAAGFFNVGMAALFMGVAMATAGDSSEANDAESDPSRPSMLFNGAVNTTANGRPVPLCYGELGVGSHVISGGFFTEDSMT